CLTGGEDEKKYVRDVIQAPQRRTVPHKSLRSLPHEDLLCHTSLRVALCLWALADTLHYHAQNGNAISVPLELCQESREASLAPIGVTGLGWCPASN
ncbi:hypothetical protein NDU88_004380, partial [Pleurodeles waltl]